jgi:hypothetical protein
MSDTPTPTPTPTRSRGGDAWPIVLIVVGALVLLNNLGLFQLGALLGLLNYWPVALVAVGLNLLTNDRYRTPIIGGAIALALLLWSLDGGAQRLVGGTSAAEVVAVEHQLEGAAAARVTLDLGVGRVRIDDAAASGVLASGSVALGRGESLEESYGRENGTALLELRSRGVTGSTTFGTAEDRSWALSLTREVPLALRVNAGVGQNRIDLRNARLVDMSFRGGVGESVIELPAGAYVASVDVGVGESTVRVPSAAAVRLTLSTGLGSTNVRGEWNRVGDVYTTPGYESAQERIELRVSGGIGAVTVERR